MRAEKMSKYDFSGTVGGGRSLGRDKNRRWARHVGGRCARVSEVAGVLAWRKHIGRMALQRTPGDRTRHRAPAQSFPGKRRRHPIVLQPQLEKVEGQVRLPLASGGSGGPRTDLTEAQLTTNRMAASALVDP